MACKNTTSTIPAKRFQFKDNQNILPQNSFYGVNVSDVLNGVLNSTQTDSSVLGSLGASLGSALPGSNLLNTALNGIESLPNSGGSLLSDVESAIGGVTSVIGTVINDVGQVVNTAINDVCGVAETALNDAFSLVNSVVGGATGALSSIFGSITGQVPVLKSLTNNCLSNLFRGPLNLKGNNNLCNGLNSSCGNGVLGSLVSTLTCGSGTLGNNGYNPLTTALQGNFLSNVGQQALGQLGVNNVMSSMSNCSTNPFSEPVMNNFALTTLQNSSNTTSLLDFGAVGGSLLNNLPSIGSMVPNAISNFTNNFNAPNSPVFNVSNDNYTPLEISANTITNAFNNINSNWSSSSVDGIPSVANMLDKAGNSLSNTLVSKQFTQFITQNSTASQFTDPSQWSSLNNSLSSNNLVNVTMGMQNKYQYAI